MEIKYKSNEDKVWNEFYPRIFFLIKENKWTGRSAGAVFGLGGGIFAIAAGVLFPLFSVFEETSFIFLILTLPLLMFGAHCLDLLEK